MNSNILFSYYFLFSFNTWLYSSLLFICAMVTIWFVMVDEFSLKL